MIDKVVACAELALEGLTDGSMIHVGGFAEPNGTPSELISTLARLSVKDLVMVTLEAGCGTDYFDRLRERQRTAPVHEAGVPLPSWYVPPGLLVETHQVAKVITAWAAEMRNDSRSPLEEAIERGEVFVELLSQGSLTERVRAAQAGLAAVYSPVGVGTFTAAGKEVRRFEGRDYVLETALRADFALIRAYRADRYGNLVYRGTARTINPVMAGAARVTVAEVDELVEPGQLNPEQIVTPGVFVDRVLVRPNR